MGPIILFIGAIFLLMKSSDFFTDASEKIGLHFGMPKFLIGVTIVAIGTSLPELVSSIIAVVTNNSEIVVGNVIGSNITNIFLVLAVVAIIAKKIKVEYDLIGIDMPFLLGSAFLLILALMDGQFSLIEAILFIVLTIIYMIYTVKQEEQNKNVKQHKLQKKKLPLSVPIILLLSAIGIYFGAKFTVDSVVAMSEIFKIGKEILAVTIVALGTSLPELAVSISAARKGRTEMAIGNVLGSNIFNSFAIMGLAGLFGKIVVPNIMISLGLPVMLIATLMYFFITLDKKTTKWEGWLLLIFYMFFIGYMAGIM
ncbi:calcium/sodium antiporter [Candidatus Woesearchaeota archaeon]|nr:calcium/sodium antiporter [Candidatus Woesearchaeota archaeon]